MNTITLITFIIFTGFTGFTNQPSLKKMTFGNLDPNTPYRVQYDGITSTIVRFSNENGKISIPWKWKKNTGMHKIVVYKWKYIDPKPGELTFQDIKD